MRAPLVVLIAITSGCVFSHAVAVGAPQSPRPDDCAIQIAQDPPEELLSEYKRVGSVCISVGNDRVLADRGGRAELQRRACELGGEVVSASGPCTVTCGDDSCDGTEFAVMRARPTGR